jgi:hypothetical protein
MKCDDCGMNCHAAEGIETPRGFFCWVCCPSLLEAQPVVAAAPVVAASPVKRDALNECRVRAMKAFFKAAQADGMDTKDVDGMRAALAGYLGRMVKSRRDLSAGEWRECAAGIEVCLLAW